MSHHKAHVRSSRRVPPLTDKEIDHEIDLVDHDLATTSRDTKPPSVWTDQSRQSGPRPASSLTLDRSESQAPLAQHASEGGTLSDDGVPDTDPSPGPSRLPQPSEPDRGNLQVPGLEEPSNIAQHDRGRASRGSDSHPRLPTEPESEIDILYENQRGGFLCGIPLFSSAALGNLDPPAWTNSAHRPSPTDIHTAQVPDPSWQWAWPEWRINHDEQIQADGDGWEYSFMFSKKFSWHRPNWYGSFVRRRAWIRRRIKISIGYQAADEHAMNPAYFTVEARRRSPSPFAITNGSERVSLDRRSWVSQGNSRRSRESARGEADDSSAPPEAKTAQDLMIILRQSRIDREKLEAVENYVNNCTDDLLPLQNYMHEIMAVFVFQTSRKALLSRLTQLHDEVAGSAHEDIATSSKATNLAAAIKHADEEVRRLEYWSDIKGMAENGEAVRAVDDRNGWDSGWQGLDKSGATGIKQEQIPR